MLGYRNDVIAATWNGTVARPPVFGVRGSSLAKTVEFRYGRLSLNLGPRVMIRAADLKVGGLRYACSLSGLPIRLRRPHTRYCRRFTVNPPPISAKLVSARRKCPNLRYKCPTFFRAICHIFVCFHTHSGFERLFSNIFFAESPPDIAESLDKAAHPAKVEVFHWK